jgi:hypothetical protein
LSRQSTAALDLPLSPLDAVHLIHAAMDLASRAGFVVTGRLELIAARNPDLALRNEVKASVGTLDDGRGAVATATLTASVRPAAMNAEQAKVIAGAFGAQKKAWTPNATGEVCFKCGSPNMAANGACMKCLDCGESNGCS